MKRKNILVTDMDYIEDWDFIKGLESSIGESFEQVAMVSNKLRSRLYNIIRYFLYFYNPFKLFLNRGKYQRIVCWQAFYGVVFVFYHLLFNVKCQNEVTVVNLIYKPKNNIIGKIYHKWLSWILKSGYIHCYISGSKTHCEYLHEEFGIPMSQLHFVHYCREDDAAKTISDENPIGSDYVLGLGRSNRDWEWVINCFKESDRNLVIVCDDLNVNKSEISSNITIIKDIWGDEMLKYLRHCKCQVCSFFYPEVASGEMVYVQGLNMSKPIVVTAPCCITDDYVKDGVTGIIVKKDKKAFLDAIESLFTDDELYNNICKNARSTYENEYNLFQYGRKAGEGITKQQ